MKPEYPDKEERIYHIDPINADYPSVTTIIGQLDKSGPLMGWAVKMTIEYLQQHKEELVADPTDTYKKAKAWYKEVSEKAKDYGSNLHNLLEVYLKGQRVEGLLQEFPELKPSLEEFKGWQKAHNFKLLESEHIVWSTEYRFAGTLDCVGMIDDRLFVVDFKSSKAIYP